MPISPALLLRVALAAALFLAGWLVNGWRWDARMNDLRRTYAEATTKASEEARERESVLAEALAIIDAERTAERTKADEENARLRAAVDAGVKRLRVNVRCPAPRLPEAPAGSGVDHGAGAELDPSTRPDYFALRSGLIRVEAKLKACQAIINEVVK